MRKTPFVGASRVSKCRSVECARDEDDAVISVCYAFSGEVNAQFLFTTQHETTQIPGSSAAAC